MQVFFVKRRKKQENFFCDIRRLGAQTTISGQKGRGFSAKAFADRHLRQAVSRGDAQS